MSATCGSLCCPTECNDDKCGCKCGESVFVLGAFFFVCAAAFYGAGALFGWNGPDTMFQQGMTYHAFNMFWFYLALVTMVGGVVYAKVVRGGKAFAREPCEALEQPGEEDGFPVPAPAPYVMLAADP